MTWCYFLLLALTVLYGAWLVVSRPRQGALFGLALIALEVEAFPWHLAPVGGLALGMQAGAIALATMVFLGLRRDATLEGLVRNPYVFLLFGFWLLALTLSVVPAPSSEGLFKSVFFAIKILLPLLALSLLAPFGRDEVRTLITAIMAGSILVAVNMFAFGDFSASRVALSEEVGPLALARNAGLGASIALYGLLIAPGVRIRWRLASLATLVPLIGAMLLTGSRGPLVSLLFMAACAAAFLAPDWRARAGALGRMALLGVGGVVALPVLASMAPSLASIERLMTNLTMIGENTSDMGRVKRIEVAWQGILDSGGLGIGTGNFGRLYGVQSRDYPHNLLVEVTLEQGLLGLALVLLIAGATLVTTARLGRRARAEPGLAALAAMWFFTMANAMVSGDITTNHLFWLTGGLIWLLRSAPPDPVQATEQAPSRAGSGLRVRPGA